VSSDADIALSSARSHTAGLPSGGRVVFTSRSHGNLSTAAGKDCARGASWRESLARELGVRRLCASRQVHGTHVNLVTEPAGAGAGALPIDADGHATMLRGVAVAVLAADCLPVGIGGRGAVAMVHAGWRGLAAGVLERGVDVLASIAGDGPLAAVIGPSAGPCCYEVGPEVKAALGLPAQRGLVDLRGLARERLLGAGVDNVALVGGCTICDERYFSYRREGPEAGRQAGVAWLS
jgi:YfiH family protein